jgi:hypothetical protein
LNFIEKLQGWKKEITKTMSIEAKAVPFHPHIPQIGSSASPIGVPMEGDFV